MKTKNLKVLSLFLSLLLLLSPLSLVTTAEPYNKLSVTVRLMALDTETWRARQSDPITIDKNGTYRIEIRDIPSLDSVATLSLRTDKATFDYPNEFVNAEPVSIDLWGAVVSFKNITINDTEVKTMLGQRNLVEQWGTSAGNVGIDLWNAWYAPSRLLTGVSEVVQSGGDDSVIGFGLPDGEGICSIAMDVIVDGVDIPAQDEVAPREHGVIPRKLSAAEVVDRMGTGWNLGNTFDSYIADSGLPVGYANKIDNVVALEMQWIGGVENITSRRLIDNLYESGFDTLRIPITWHKIMNSETYEISDKWLDRIEQVVNIAYNKKMYVIINTHHDERIFDLSGDINEGEKALREVWRQVSERFRDYDEYLIFEGLNEPHKRLNEWGIKGKWDWTGNQELYGIINRWNEAFVDTVRGTGGNNAGRILMVPTYAAGGTKAQLDAFKVPSDDKTEVNKLVLSVHKYEPFDFATQSTTDRWTEEWVNNALTTVSNRANELGLPVILGEWGVSNNNKITPNTDEGREKERARYCDFFIRTATSLNMRAIIWDNGVSKDKLGEETFSFINRRTGEPHFKAITDAIANARGTRYVKGRVINNNDETGISDALEILMYLADMPQSIIFKDTTGRAFLAAMITEPKGDAPTLSDALQILMYLSGMPQSVLNGDKVYLYG